MRKKSKLRSPTTNARRNEQSNKQKAPETSRQTNRGANKQKKNKQTINIFWKFAGAKKIKGRLTNNGNKTGTETGAKKMKGRLEPGNFQNRKKVFDEKQSYILNII